MAPAIGALNGSVATVPLPQSLSPSDVSTSLSYVADIITFCVAAAPGTRRRCGPVCVVARCLFLVLVMACAVVFVVLGELDAEFLYYCPRSFVVSPLCRQ